MTSTTVTSQCEEDPISLFLYALKAPETKRQYPRRLKVLDYLKLEGPLEQQVKELLTKTKQSPQWLRSCLIRFIAFQKERAIKGKITYG